MKTSEQFINESKKIHYDKYNYSMVDYVNNYTKVNIICHIHGVFKQTPKHHLKYGCKKCADDKLKIRKKDLKLFINQSNKKHNNKFDYSLVDYKNNYTKVSIICPIHGVFKQTPNNHLKESCFKCAHEKINKINTLDIKNFIEDSNKKHHNKYDYSLVCYKHGNIKIDIICHIHGVFKQTPNAHKKGQGCQKCGIIKNRLHYIEKLKNRLNKGEQISPNFNSQACSFFDDLSEKNNVFIQHAMNGGEYRIKELGYWLDGYDLKNNVVYEWDESSHFFKGKLREKDLIRQIEIEKFLKCKFIRIDGRNKK
jgi:hypothetical protein